MFILELIIIITLSKKLQGLVIQSVEEDFLPTRSPKTTSTWNKVFFIILPHLFKF